jgi:hypothetical protein
LLIYEYCRTRHSYRRRRRRRRLLGLYNDALEHFSHVHSIMGLLLLLMLLLQLKEDGDRCTIEL